MTEPIKNSPHNAGCLVRLFWMILGNVAIFFLLVSIVEKHAKFPSVLDIAYLLTLVALLAARYVDIRYLDGMTADGGPASIAHWRKYALTLASVGVGGLIAAHVLEIWLA